MSDYHILRPDGITPDTVAIVQQGVAFIRETEVEAQIKAAREEGIRAALDAVRAYDVDDDEDGFWAWSQSMRAIEALLEKDE